MIDIRRILDSCRLRKCQLFPVSVILAQENAARRCGVGENLLERVTAKDWGAPSVGI